VPGFLVRAVSRQCREGEVFEIRDLTRQTRLL
jgi:hypothetical protein